MAGEAVINFVGNVGKDPEMFFTPNGDGVCKISVAVTGRRKKNDAWEDGPTTWFRVSLWRRDGEAAADRIVKGDRVAVSGRLIVTEYEKDGVKRQVPEVEADYVGVIMKPLPKETKAVDSVEESSPW